MAYDPGAIDATLAAAVGDEPALIAELRGMAGCGMADARPRGEFRGNPADGDRDRGGRGECA